MQADKARLAAATTGKIFRMAISRGVVFGMADCVFLTRCNLCAAERRILLAGTDPAQHLSLRFRGFSRKIAANRT